MSLRNALLALVLSAVSCGRGFAVEPKPADAVWPASMTNTIGMKFVHVPPGRFTMGNAASFDKMTKLFPEIEAERLRGLTDETPAHEVRITKRLYFGAHEVTVGQFRKFVAASGYKPESIADGTGGYGYNRDYDPEKSKRGDAFEGRDPKYSWENPGFPQTDEHPVVNVTFGDAQAMAKWLSEKEGAKYRLPTEAEWEYACRAGTTTQFFSGDEPKSLADVANIFDADSAANWEKWRRFALPTRDGFAFTAPVGKFKPNAFGLYDTHGNAWEWTADYYGEDYYAKSPVDDPQGPTSGRVRVRRGGSWHTWPLYARSSYRNWNTEATRYTLVGMRLVREADGGTR
jgi:sulfatase modifying factor 1